MEVFAWTRSERTAVPRFVMEHKLKIYPLSELVVHKRRPVAPEGRLALKEKVFRWLGEGLIRKMDYSGLNKACAKDMYPLPEEGEELASLMGYPYKGFLQLPKEYNQIKMAEEDEEKTGFHMEEGVYCFTHMPKELKNYAATLQRIMEKFLTDQRGWNEIRQVTNIGHPKRRRRSNVMSTAKKRDNKLCATDREGGNPDTCFLCKPTAARNGNMLHLNRKRVQALIHTARSLRTVFRKHKVKVVTNGPMEETLKISRREGRLGKWATEIPYDISYVQRKEVEGSVIRKFFSHGEQVEKIPNANKEGTLNLSMELYTKSNPMPRA
ncbi:reverse transcriptase domain-containing protein [Tanacetum coccineum]